MAFKYRVSESDEDTYSIAFREAVRPICSPTWEDWLAVSGKPELLQVDSGYDNYIYLLEAAAAGHGLASGWRGA